MSFDISLERADGESFEVNITGNLGGFFAWALHGADPEQNKNRSDSRDAIFGKRPTDGMKALDGMKVAEARLLLAAAITKATHAKPDFLAQFNSPNGWGTWPIGLQVLQEMYGWCNGADDADAFEVGL